MSVINSIRLAHHSRPPCGPAPFRPACYFAVWIRLLWGSLTGVDQQAQALALNTERFFAGANRLITYCFGAGPRYWQIVIGSKRC